MGKLESVPKAANIIGLQITDLIAYPIACHIMWPERPNPAFDIIKGNIESGVKTLCLIKRQSSACASEKA